MAKWVNYVLGILAIYFGLIQFEALSMIKPDFISSTISQVAIVILGLLIIFLSYGAYIVGLVGLLVIISGGLLIVPKLGISGLEFLDSVNSGFFGAAVIILGVVLIFVVYRFPNAPFNIANVRAPAMNAQP